MEAILEGEEIIALRKMNEGYQISIGENTNEFGDEKNLIKSLLKENGKIKLTKTRQINKYKDCIFIYDTQK